jgi:transcriptional regulator with XRE-family HTH domain
MGVREAAREVGVSPATLSRVENGKLPDLETFGKICRWLGENPSQFLGLPSNDAGAVRAQVHFKKGKAIELDSAEALAKMIILVQKTIRDEDSVD